jgi:hypothetical protein
LEPGVGAGTVAGRADRESIADFVSSAGARRLANAATVQHDHGSRRLGVSGRVREEVAVDGGVVTMRDEKRTYIKASAATARRCE